MLSQAQRTAILELSAKGVSKREIAHVLQVSRQTVRTVLRANSTNVPEIQRAEKAEPYREQILEKKAQTSYSEFVAGLLRAQWHERQDSALEWRIRRANLPERWSLESFPWSRQPGVSRKQIRGFAELDFVAKHENLVFTGKTGVGKTGLAFGLLLKALQNGYRCQFIRAQNLFDEMYASLADRSTRQLLN